MCKYSIIIPVYNKELYVARTIESVLKQSVRDWEIIAVDDESGDSSLQILQELSKKDERIKVYSIENKGVSNARNFAMKQACGEYFMFLDADDEMQPGILSEYDLILAKNDVDIIFTAYNVIAETGEVSFTGYSGLQEGLYDAKILFPYFAQKQNTCGYFGFVTNKLVKASFISENDIEFDTNFKLAEDLDFFTKLYRVATKVYFSDAVSFRYMTNPVVVTTPQVVDYYSQIIIRIRIKDLMAEKNVLNDALDVCNIQITKYICCYIFDSLPESYKEFRDKMKKLYSNKSAMNSITLKNLSLSKKLVVLLAKFKLTGMIYALLAGKRFIRRKLR